MLSMCLLFCFVVFWILCCVVCEKIKNKKLLITKKNKPWEKPRSVGGQFSSDQTNQQFVPTAARSDCVLESVPGSG